MDDDRDETRFQIKVMALCWAVVAAIGLLWSVAAQAQNALRSTPDIAIAATSTGTFVFPGGPATRVSVKNDCVDDLYFDLRPGRESIDSDSNAFPILLKQAETFTFTGNLFSIGVSHGSASTASCTFTLVPVR